MGGDDVFIPKMLPAGSPDVQQAAATISYATVAVETVEDEEVYPRLTEKAARQDAVFDGTAGASH